MSTADTDRCARLAYRRAPEIGEAGPGSAAERRLAALGESPPRGRGGVCGL